MSYCRFSDDGYRSDVYAYADVQGGVTIHVAAKRICFPPDYPPCPEIKSVGDGQKLSEEVDAVGTWLKGLDGMPRAPIGLSRDGQSFPNLDFESAAALVADLRAEGYQLREGIEAEILEDAKTPEVSP